MHWKLPAPETMRSLGTNSVPVGFWDHLGGRVNLQMEAKGGVKQIVLTGEDIPGAKLPRGNAEECTVPQLRRWLLCRGAKTSGKKAELVKRFVCTMVFY